MVSCSEGHMDAINLEPDDPSHRKPREQLSCAPSAGTPPPQGSKFDGHTNSVQKIPVFTYTQMCTLTLAHMLCTVP